MSVHITTNEPVRPADTDRLIFRPNPDSDENTYIVGWTGPWPPPPHLTVVQGHVGYNVFDPDNTDERTERAVEMCRELGLEIQPYRLFSASSIDTRAPADENWFRAALYIRVEPRD